MKFKHRLTALVLACFMVVSLLPSTAFAAETKTECAADAHVWGLSSILKHGTCTTKGIGKYECSVCGKSEYQQSPEEHTKPTDQSAITTVPANCGKAGSVKYTCTGACKQEVTEVLPATGDHDWKDEQTVPGTTCTENTKVGTACTVCGATKGTLTEVPGTASGHDYKASTDPDEGYIAFTSCDVASATVQKCSKCGDIVVTSVAATTHTWEDDDGEGALIDATCTEPNGVGQHCAKCSATQTASFDASSPVYEGPKGHSWTKHEAVTATCQVAGKVQYWECENCGKFATGSTAPAANATTGLLEEAPAEGELGAHTYAANDQGTKKDVVKANCEKGESYKLVKTCTVCEQEIVVQTVTGEETGAVKGDHVKVLDGTALKAATCTTSGIAKYKCEVCGESLGYQTMPAAHKYTEKITQAATCTEAGEKTLTCSVCEENVDGHTKTEAIEAPGHDFDDTIEANVSNVQAATCVEAGSQTVKCKNCNETDDVVIPATGEHEWEEDQVVEVCGQKTQIGTFCSVCNTQKPGTTVEEFGDVLEHDYKASTDEEDGYVAATCTTGGTNVQVCERCGDVQTTATGSLGHLWGEEQFVAANCEHAEGVMKTCTRTDDCGATEFEPFPAGLGEAQKSHSWVHHDAVAATCEKTGMPEYWQCSMCNQYKTSANGEATKTAPTATSQLTHTYGANPEIKKNLVEANCTETGSYDSYKKCTLCQKEILQEEGVEIPVDADAHVKKLVGNALKQASCVNGTTGIGKYECEKCHTTLGYQTITVDEAHSYPETPNSTKSSDPTCTEPGEKVYVCANNCGIDKTEEVEATGHNYPETPDETKSKKATCGKDGKNVYVCANNCNVDKEEVVTASGAHEYEEETIDATCLEPEKVGQVCKTCGAEGTTTVVSGSTALGHQLVLDTEDEDYKAATCTEGGKDVKVCTREGCLKGDHPTDTTWRTVTDTQPLTHDWGGDELVEASCDTAAGVKQTCQREGCGATQVIPFTGDLAVGATGAHKWVHHDAVAATCAKTGMPAYDQCSSCNKYKAADGTATATAPTATSKLAHTPGEATRENVVNPTKEDDGTVTPGSYDEVIKCTVCGATISTTPKTITHDANNHTYTDLKNTLKAADCTTNGIGKYQCSACDATSYLTIEGGHVWSEEGIETEAATCGKAGVMTYVCEREAGCTAPDKGENTATKTETIPATGQHHLVEVNEAATCLKPGKTGQKCDNKGCEYAEVTTTTALDHDWVLDPDSEENVEGTCQTKGKTAYKCSRGDNCDGTTENPGTKVETDEHFADHVKDEPEYVAATCTEGAKSVVKCATEGCDYVFEDDSEDLSALEPALGHTLVEKAKQAATCIAAGHEAGKQCSVCNKWFKSAAATAPEVTTGVLPIDKVNGHNYDMTAGKVTEDGSCDPDHPIQKITEYTCDRCDENTDGHTKEVKEDVDHTWGEDAEVIEAATCTKPGKQSATCTECQTVDAEAEIPALGHDYSGEPEVEEATCTKAGSKTWTCQNENCDEELDEDGNGKTKVETIPMKAHTYAETYQEATCTKNAVAGQICMQCHEGKVNADGTEEFMEVPNSALGHNWVKDTSKDDVEGGNKAATCTENGLQWYKCSRGDACDATAANPGTKSAVITASGTHTPAAEDEHIEATCTESGKAVTKCSQCGTIISTTDLGALSEPATGHKNIISKPAVAATCQTKGYQAAKYCNDCKKYVKLGAAGTYVVINESEIEIPVDPDAHVQDITKTLKAATCGAAGIGKAVCSKCEADLGYVAIPATGEHEAYDENGKCSVCGAEKACDHSANNIEVVVAVAATCTTDGKTSGVKCLDCNTIIEGCEPVIAKGHQWGANGKCTACDATKPAEPSQPVEPEGPCKDGHTWVVDSTDSTKHVCSECDVAAEAHTWVVDSTDSTKHVCSKCDVEAEAHTWGDADEDGKITCTKCGAEKPGNPGPEQPHTHTYGDWNVTKEATCAEAGSRTRTCSDPDCDQSEGYTQTETIAATGLHSFVNGVCSVCGAAQCETHSFGSWTTDTAATCTEKGTEKRTCSVCGQSETRETDALGHTEETLAAVAPTCTETGLTAGKKCSVCSMVLEAQQTVAATGHSWGDAYNDNGTMKRECSVCHTVEEVGAHTHSYTWAVTKEATCTEKGIETGTCVCGDTTTREIDMIDHDYEVTVEEYLINAETGTYRVYTTKTCKTCGDSSTEKATIIK